MNKPLIGFIGLGVMGQPMAGHLAEAGYKLAVHDINADNTNKVASLPNVRVMESPQAIAAVSDIVITMLPSGGVVQEVVLGDKGLIHGLKAGALLLDTSSSEPWLTVSTAKTLAEKDVAMIDAPVSGARAGAENAELVFMAGGDGESLARVRPLLEIMGKQIFHLGPVGAGHAMKCINNLITSITLLATAEGLAIGKRFGLDPEVMTDVLNVSTGESWISRTHIKQRITSRAFDDPFKLELMVKDIGIALELAGEIKLPLPLSELNQQLWRSAGEQAAPGASVSEAVRWLETVTGVEIKKEE